MYTEEGPESQKSNQNLWEEGSGGGEGCGVAMAKDYRNKDNCMIIQTSHLQFWKGGLDLI